MTGSAPVAGHMTVGAHIEDGLAHFHGGRFGAAAHAFQGALDLEPDNADVLLKLGAALSAAGDGKQAVELYNAALARDPDNTGLLTNLGNALVRLEQYESAIERLSRVAILQPQNGLAAFNLGAALQLAERLEEAAVAYRAALRDPTMLVRASLNLGDVLMRQNRCVDALAVYDSALQCAPDDANLHWNRACTLLTLGECEHGWREYEWRWRMPGRAARHDQIPLWNGDPLEARSILLHAEQGFGDTIQFIRYASALAARGGRISIEVQPALKRLVDRLGGFASVHAVGETLPNFDLQCPLLGLPLRIGRIGCAQSYLAGAADTRSGLAMLQAKRAPNALKVGVAWAGSATNTADARRSVPVAALVPFGCLDGIAWTNLQNGPRAAVALSQALGRDVFNPMAIAADFADTADVIAGLDLVISVDTAVAHLAAAMGKTVWLLNRFDSCWRWGRDGEQTDWYETMRIFRQPSPGDWRSPIGRVAATLADQAGALRSQAGGRIF